MGAKPVPLIRSDAEMRALGANLTEAVESGAVITLSGELGTGKTTLVRGALEARGVDRVRSPTYTLIEYYSFDRISVAHFDLYRLADPEELEFLGFRDYLNPSTLCFIEWPERVQGYLQAVDLEIKLEYHPQGRQLHLNPVTSRGNQLLESVA